MQTRCIVKGEAQKSPLFWRFSGGFDFLRIACSLRIPQKKPLNLIKSPIFASAPCKTACLYNAPSMHTVDLFLPNRIRIRNRIAATFDGQNRQSPIAGVQRARSALANHFAVPCGTNVKRMNANHAIRNAAQRTQGLWGLISVCFEGDMTANER